MLLSFVGQFTELVDNIKFDHGYTANSPPVINVRALLFSFFFFFCFGYVQVDAYELACKLECSCTGQLSNGLLCVNKNKVILRNRLNCVSHMSLSTYIKVVLVPELMFIWI